MDWLVSWPLETRHQQEHQKHSVDKKREIQEQCFNFKSYTVFLLVSVKKMNMMAAL